MQNTYLLTPEYVAKTVCDILAEYDDAIYFNKKLADQEPNAPFENRVLYFDSLDLFAISAQMDQTFNINTELFKYKAGEYTPAKIADIIMNKLKNKPENAEITGKSVRQNMLQRKYPKTR